MTHKTMSLPREGVGESTNYDAVVIAHGYEARSTHVLAFLGARATEVVVIDYESSGVLHYDDNGVTISQVPIAVKIPRHTAEGDLSRELGRCLADIVRRREGSLSPIWVAVDISSMDRDLMATCVNAIRDIDVGDAVVDFYYAHGEFDENLVGSEGAVLVNRPVSGFEGWPSQPDSPLTCIVGLGFESHLAAAAIETLEPTRVIAMLAEGIDSRFDLMAQEKNQAFLESTQRLEYVHYKISDLRQLIADMNATVESLASTGRVVIVPLGPKPLALSALLVASAFATDVTVWRISADSGRQQEDRRASGEISTVRIRLGAPAHDVDDECSSS